MRIIEAKDCKRQSTNGTSDQRAVGREFVEGGVRSLRTVHFAAVNDLDELMCGNWVARDRVGERNENRVGLVPCP